MRAADDEEAISLPTQAREVDGSEVRSLRLKSTEAMRLRRIGNISGWLAFHG